MHRPAVKLVLQPVQTNAGRPWETEFAVNGMVAAGTPAGTSLSFFVGLHDSVINLSRLPSRTIYLTWQSPFANLPQTKSIDLFDHLLDHYLLEQLNDL